MARQQAVAPLDIQDTTAPKPTIQPALADARSPSGAEGAGNPARDLQRELAAAAASGAFGASSPPTVEGRWSQRRTLAFIVVSCGGFWAAVAFAMSRLF